MERHSLAKYIAIGVALYEVSSFAFSVRSRKEIGERDNWTCQYPNCDDGTGVPKSFKNGWMVFAGHVKTHDKKDPAYDLPSSGRIHCIEHEIKFHERELKIAELMGENTRLHKSALEKLSRVDWRTFDYRKHPENYVLIEAESAT